MPIIGAVTIPIPPFPDDYCIMVNFITPKLCRRALQGALLLMSALLPLRSQAFDAVLQGESTNSSIWITGNLMGWRELDYVPCRVYLSGGPANNQAINVDFDHIR